MPSGLYCIHEPEIDEIAQTDRHRLVDIVAVHGLNENSDEAWTELVTGTNWLRDLLPQNVHVARVLTYGYDAVPSTFLADEPISKIERFAKSLVSELYAERELSGTRKRAIIFVCHGFGGLIVKKSLAFSSTRTAAKVEHLWDQFISTFAIIFFGTPHDHTIKSHWLALEKASNSTSHIRVPGLDRQKNAAGDNVISFESITSEFAPILKQFRLFFFWEESRTILGNFKGYLVEPSSAVLNIDNTEKAGIHDTHINMTKYTSCTSSGYRTVIEAISRYCNEAPPIISRRWSQATIALNQMRAGEAYELGGIAFDVFSGLPSQHREIEISEVTDGHFFLPQDALENFIGREDMLAHLGRVFFPKIRVKNPPKRKSFVVFGMGGSGKTQFCSKFAEDYRGRYASVFTIHSATTDSIAESFSKIATLGGLEPTENAGRHFLSQLKKTWLLIIDNADDPSLKLQDLYPSGTEAHILITTRNPDFRQEGSLGFLELNGLKEMEAIELLLTKADIPKPWASPILDNGKLIAETLGYLALALIHAGNCIFRRVCDLSNYLDLYSATRNMLRRGPSTTSIVSESELMKAVYSTFDVSFKSLLRNRTQETQDASDLLRISSFYHFERIPVEIFTRGILNRRKIIETPHTKTLGSRFLRSIQARLEPPKALPSFLKDGNNQLNVYRINWAVSELQSHSLITFNGRDRKTFSLHPLVHAWARDSLESRDRSVWACIAFDTLMESIMLPPEGNSERDGDFHRDIIPHLKSCLSVHPRPITHQIEGQLNTMTVQLARIFSQTWLIVIGNQIHKEAKCGYVLASRGDFELAAKHLEIAKNALIQLLGPGNDKSMKAMLGLSGVLWGLGRMEEAIALQRQVVDTQTKLRGIRHEQTLQAMDNLGRSYWLDGQYHEALDIQERTVHTSKEVMGQTHGLTLSALDNYGVTLGAWHRYKESVEIHREVLQTRQVQLGKTHPDTITTSSNLAMALLDLGSISEARSLMIEVHKQRQSQLGKEHPWTLWALCWLSKIHVKAGELQQAEELLIWGIAAGERSLGKDHLGVLMGQGELARVYTWQGRLEEAEALLVATVKGLELSRGIPHPDCVYALWKLARLYERQGQREKSERACQLALERADLRLTREHPMAKKIEQMLQELRHPSSNDKTPKGDGQNHSAPAAKTREAELPGTFIVTRHATY
ncbi:hypothetical protein NHQ30_000196 [Ciborinia camelliae]|nr:hypothetical protein NHQ30_000196 [Ciborinia camelliae]